MSNEWIDIKELSPDDAKSVLVKYKSGRTCVRKVKTIFERPWLMVHNNTDETDFRADRIITHYKEIEEPSQVAMYIASRIQELRKEAGMTQTQLAEKCGMAQPNIARIEAGTYATSIDVLSRIAEALGKRIELV